jgi:hypothetical protein
LAKRNGDISGLDGKSDAASLTMIRLSSVLLGLFVLGCPLRAEIDVGREIDALAMKETGLRWDGRPGLCGELSAWQITEKVWRQHMAPAPFSDAREPALARVCALRHVRWLIAQIERRGLAVTPQCVATAWHFGLSRAARSTEWGLEVANLYNDLPCPR